MSEEKKTIELTEEDLEKVTGGDLDPNYIKDHGNGTTEHTIALGTTYNQDISYCPVCGAYLVFEGITYRYCHVHTSFVLKRITKSTFEVIQNDFGKK